MSRRSCTDPITFEELAPFGCGNVSTTLARRQRALTWQRGEELVRLAYQAPRALEQLLIIEVREAVHASRRLLPSNDSLLGDAWEPPMS